MDHVTLTNKANLWQSNYKWNFTENGTLGTYIENISKAKVLGIAKDGKVNEDSPKQLWERGVADSQGYFYLKANSESTFLTAMSADTLAIKGAH